MRAMKHPTDDVRQLRAAIIRAGECAASGRPRLAITRGSWSGGHGAKAIIALVDDYLTPRRQGVERTSRHRIGQPPNSTTRVDCRSRLHPRAICEARGGSLIYLTS